MSKIAILRYLPERGKWCALTENGYILSQSHDKQRVILQIKAKQCRKAVELGYTDLKEDDTTPLSAGSIQIVGEKKAESTPNGIYFTGEEKFKFISDFTRMVLYKKANALLISGGSGLGKTYNVLQQINDAGLKNTDEFEAQAAGLVGDDGDETEKLLFLSGVGDYIYKKGYSSPRALFNSLWYNRNKLVVYDDCDSVLQDDVCSNILKAVLDTTGKRIVSWEIDKKRNDKVPLSFEFKGSAIFITNIEQDRLDEAVKTRCFRVDVELTTDERMQRISDHLLDLEPDVPIEIKKEVFEFLKENINLCPKVNFRTFKFICALRQSGLSDWKRSGQYNLMSH